LTSNYKRDHPLIVATKGKTLTVTSFATGEKVYV
jgi:hypothetical protein